MDKNLPDKLRATASESKRQMLDAAADAIEQLLEDLRGDCSCCIRSGDFHRCMEEVRFVNKCEDCDQDCKCKGCDNGSEWAWRGVQKEGQ